MRARTASPGAFAVGPLVLDLGARRLIGPAGGHRLVASLFVVLRRLMGRPGQVITIEELVGAAYGDPDREPTNAEGAVRLRILRARAAIERVGGEGDVIRAVPGIGYVMEAPPLVVRFYTDIQAAALDQLIASHPNATLRDAVAA